MSEELRHSRETLDKFGLEYEAFSTRLQSDAQHNPALRPFLADTVQLHAVVESTRRRSHQVNDHHQIMEDSRRLDSGWRVLSHRLRQSRGLSPECRLAVERLDQFDVQLCGCLKFEPQVDRRELTRSGQALIIHIRSLCDDIDFELRQPGVRNDLLLEAGKTQQAAVSFSDRITRGAPYSGLVAGYREFLAAWVPLSRRLSALNSRYVERSILRVEATDQQIHDLLWLHRGLDRQVLTRLADGILRQTDQIYEMVTLSVLITLPGSADVPSSASEFYGVCQHFADCVTNGQSDDELVEAYGYLVPAWVGFSRHFRGCGHDGIRRSLSDIENRLSALRDPLRVPGGFRRDQARERVAALEAMTEHLEDDINVWLSSHKEHDGDRIALTQLSRKFRAIAHGLHTNVLNGVAEPALREQCADAYAVWVQIHSRISKCDAPEREHIVQVLVDISRELISVEALFFS